MNVLRLQGQASVNCYMSHKLRCPRSELQSGPQHPLVTLP